MIACQAMNDWWAGGDFQRNVKAARAHQRQPFVKRNIALPAQARKINYPHSDAARFRNFSKQSTQVCLLKF